MAVRLAYFLWSSPPDDELYEVARRGELKQSGNLGRQANRMLNDRRSDEFIASFTHQWLGMERLDFFQFDSRQFPEFDESVKAAARLEVYETIRTILDEKRPLVDLLRSEHVVINDLMADYYGIEGVVGRNFRQVAVPEVDASRVFSYRQPLDTFIQSLGATITAHNMSHYSDGDRKEVSKLRDQKQSELLAHFIARLKATPDGDGATLFDNTTVTLGSNINSIHYLTNCPTVVTGGGAGVKHGRHLVMDDPNTPLCNLWLSLLNGTGVGIESHGDSTAQIGELFA